MSDLADAVAMWSGVFSDGDRRAENLPQRAFNLLCELTAAYDGDGRRPLSGDFAGVPLDVSFAGLASTPAVITELVGFPPGVVDLWAEIVGLPHCYWIRISTTDPATNQKIRTRQFLFVNGREWCAGLTQSALARHHARNLALERDALALIAASPIQHVAAHRRKIAA